MLPATANPNGVGGVTLGDVAGELIAVALQQKEFDQTQEALVGQNSPSRNVYDKLVDIEVVLKEILDFWVDAREEAARQKDQQLLLEELDEEGKPKKKDGKEKKPNLGPYKKFFDMFEEKLGLKKEEKEESGVMKFLKTAGITVLGGKIAGDFLDYQQAIRDPNATEKDKERALYRESGTAGTAAFGTGAGILGGAALGAMSGAALGPIGMILGGISGAITGSGIGLATGGVLGFLFGDEIGETVFDVKEWMIETFDNIGTMITDSFDGIVNYFSETFNNIGDFFTNLFNDFELPSVDDVLSFLNPFDNANADEPQQSTPRTTGRINTAPRTRSARSEEAALRKEKLAEKLVEEQEKQLVIEKEKTAIVEEEKSRAEENIYLLEGLYEAREDQKKAAEELAKFEEEAGEKVEIGFSQEAFDLTGEGSIMGYADAEKQAQFEQLRSAESAASSRLQSEKSTAMLPYTAHTGMDPNDLRMFDRGAYKLAESQLEEDLSQLQPVLGYEYGTKDYIGMEARARGGPVEDGSDYLVGEEGPELMIPNEDGTIIPAGVSKELMKYQQQGFDVTVDNGNITLFRENEDGSSETLKSDGTRTVSGSFGTYVFDENNEVISYTKPTMAEGLSVTDYYKGDLAGERATSFSASTFNKTQFSDLASGAITGESLSVNDYSGGGRKYQKDRSGKFTGSDTFTGESYEGSSFEDVMGQMPVLTDLQRAERMFGTLDQQRAAFERPGRTPEQIDEMMAPIIKAFEQSYDEKGNLIGNEDFLPIDPNKLIPSRNEGSYLSTSQQQMSQQSSQPVVINAPQTSNSPVVNNTSVNNMSMPMSPRTHDESFTRTNNQNYNFG